MQATMVLQSMYVGQSQVQIQAQESKKARKQSKRTLGDGMPRLLSDLAFTEGVEAAERAEQEKQELIQHRRASCTK